VRIAEFSQAGFESHPHPGVSFDWTRPEWIDLIHTALAVLLAQPVAAWPAETIR